MKTLFFIFTFILLSSFLYATIINIPGDQPTIQDGIDATVNGDTVLVQPGTYLENIDYNEKLIIVGSLFLTTQDTTYISQTIIDGDSIDSVVTFESGEDSTAVITGFTITNGFSETGGGIYCYNNSNPTIEHCTFDTNSATYGSGIYCCGTSPTIVNCIFNGNSAEENGGGICCFSGSVSLIENCTFIGNSAMFGGGIKCWNNSSPMIKNCILRDNWADEYGGGIDCAYWCNPTIEYCTISGNSSELGAGISSTHESNPEITNCTISENFATAYGGGIYCYINSNLSLENVTITNNTAGMPGGGIFCYINSNLSLENVTITNNTAGMPGGGIFCQNSSPSLTNVTITDNSSAIGGAIYCRFDCHPLLINSILWNDSPQEIYFCEDGGTNSITISYSDIEGGEAGIVTNNNGTVNWLEGNIDEDPLFVDPANGDYHLTENSPCIDAGDPASPLDPDGTIADMGAFYYDQGTSVENDELQNTNYELNNHPNPFNPTTTISFSLNTENTKDAEIIIYNLKGQKIKQYSIFNNQSSIIWDGKDENDIHVSSGIYLYKLKAGDFQKVNKMVLLK